MSLNLLTGTTIWTHKNFIDYTQLQSGSPDISVQQTVVSATSTTFTFNVAGLSGVNNFYNNCMISVISGTGTGQTGRVITAYNGSTGVFTISNAWQTTPDNTSLISLTRFNSYKDILLFGIPANALILANKITTLSNFTAGDNNTVLVYVGNSNVFLTPTIGSPNLLTNVHNTYGMASITIGSGDQTYQYGSFRWFTISAPGTATFARNQLPGNPTSGSFCLPQRTDAHDIIARFAILGSLNSPATPAFDTALSFNSNLTAGQIEIATQFIIL